MTPPSEKSDKLSKKGVKGVAGVSFRMPSVIRISRTTGQIIGMEYEDLDAETVAQYGSRLARALDTARVMESTRESREREGGFDHVEIPESAGAR